jgi:hypothetical protein
MIFQVLVPCMTEKGLLLYAAMVCKWNFVGVKIRSSTHPFRPKRLIFQINFFV